MVSAPFKILDAEIMSPEDISQRILLTAGAETLLMRAVVLPEILNVQIEARGTHRCILLWVSIIQYK